MNDPHDPNYQIRELIVARLTDRLSDHSGLRSVRFHEGMLFLSFNPKIKCEDLVEEIKWGLGVHIEGDFGRVPNEANFSFIPGTPWDGYHEQLSRGFDFLAKTLARRANSGWDSTTPWSTRVRVALRVLTRGMPTGPIR